MRVCALTDGEIDGEVKQVILVHPHDGTECPEIPFDLLPDVWFLDFDSDPLFRAVRGLQLRAMHLCNTSARGCLLFEHLEHPIGSRRRAPELFAEDRVDHGVGHLRGIVEELAKLFLEGFGEESSVITNSLTCTNGA